MYGLNALSWKKHGRLHQPLQLLGLEHPHFRVPELLLDCHRGGGLWQHHLGRPPAVHAAAGHLLQVPRRRLLPHTVEGLLWQGQDREHEAKSTILNYVLIHRFPFSCVIFFMCLLLRVAISWKAGSGFHSAFEQVAIPRKNHTKLITQWMGIHPGSTSLSLIRPHHGSSSLEILPLYVFEIEPINSQVYETSYLFSEVISRKAQ